MTVYMCCVNSQGKVDTLIKVKMEKHKNLGEECGFYAQEIFSGTLVFNRVEIEVLPTTSQH
jgi:insulysin